MPLDAKNFKQKRMVIPVESFDGFPTGTILPVKAQAKSPFRDGSQFLHCDVGDNGQVSVLLDKEYVSDLKKGQELQLEFREVRDYPSGKYPIFRVFEDLPS